MHHLQTTKETEGTWSFPPSISQVSVNICCIRFEKNLDKEGFDKQKRHNYFICKVIQRRNNTINNVSRTKWNPVRFVIIRVITKLDERDEYDYLQPNWTT